MLYAILIKNNLLCNGFLFRKHFNIFSGIQEHYSEPNCFETKEENLCKQTVFHHFEIFF